MVRKIGGYDRMAMLILVVVILWLMYSYLIDGYSRPYDEYHYESVINNISTFHDYYTIRHHGCYGA